MKVDTYIKKPIRTQFVIANTCLLPSDWTEVSEEDHLVTLVLVMRKPFFIESRTVAIIPPNSILENPDPVTIIQLSNNSEVCPEPMQLLYLKVKYRDEKTKSVLHEIKKKYFSDEIEWEILIETVKIT